MTFATFIISTGRCGTQWIARTLAEAYPEVLAVEHEPLHNQYESRKATTTPGVEFAAPPLVLAHIKGIERQLETRSYLECGHPSWSTLPYLAEAFKGRVRFIHLVRHPIPTAYSWLTHAAYQPPLLPHLSEKILLSPFDEAARYQDYQPRWESLSPLEKCLYYWLEVNALALEIEARTPAPWLGARYEELFGGDALQEVLAFLELPHLDQVFQERNTSVDEHRFLSPSWPDWHVIEQHPEVLKLASRLGYDLDHLDEGTLYRRYREGR